MPSSLRSTTCVVVGKIKDLREEERQGAVRGYQRFADKEGTSSGPEEKKSGTKRGRSEEEEQQNIKLKCAYAIINLFVLCKREGRVFFVVDAFNFFSFLFLRLPRKENVYTVALSVRNKNYKLLPLFIPTALVPKLILQIFN